jgi:hypothetical protein
MVSLELEVINYSSTPKDISGVLLDENNIWSTN